LQAKEKRNGAARRDRTGDLHYNQVKCIISASSQVTDWQLKAFIFLLLLHHPVCPAITSSTVSLAVSLARNVG
jgi:hypothetical protein